MKFILQILFIMVIGYLMELFLPWWSIAITAFLAGLLLTSNLSFLAGFLASGSLWLLKAWLIDADAATPLVEKVAEIFTISKSMLFAVTFFLSALVGGFAALTGAILKPKRKKSLYY